MAIDKEKYIKKYIDEGLDNTALVESLVFDIKDGVSVEDDLATLLRALHTLKGSSRMLEFRRIEELSHALESVFGSLREQRIGMSENAVKLVLSSLDLLKKGFAAIRQEKEDAIDINDHVKNLTLLAANDDFEIPDNDKTNTQQESGEETKKRKDSKSETIRLSLEKIDGIIKSIASLQALEISAKSLSQSGAELSKQIKEFYKSIKDLTKHDFAVTSNYRKLERLCERLNSSLKNYSIDAGTSIRGAHDSVISLRTLPMSVIFDSYPRYVFELSEELGKKVHLSIEGNENEIDKNIIEAMSDVFLHMVRNAVDHGIETPEERKSCGKNETGKLSIVCSRESGSMKIFISDDGRGIDVERIRKKAVKDGYVSQGAADLLSKEDLTNFIFQSGFSTSGNVSNVSGRGVGMDVVRETVESLKGSIVVESYFMEGTTFTITVPLSIAALTGFPVECGGLKFIIPSNFVDNVLLLNRENIITVVDRPEIRYNDRIIKLFFLNQVLNIKTDAIQFNDIFFVAIIRSYDDIAAIAVDNIDSMRSVILKNMPAFMESMPVFSGIVLNEDYEMASVLHIPTVLKMAKRIKSIEIKKRSAEFEKQKKSILVVDDSLPTREIEREILMSEGFIVDTAEDGSQGLKAAKQKHYDLICTDLNMPVMDGFMFIENLKKNDSLSGIPVIVISSNANEEDKAKAYKLGASRYILKNSFNNQNLLETVNELIGEKNA
ncbi:MAG: response regulator [Treponema sp.]|nr:response regulator [Treponema sp.]MCL2236713.1 response regulator [Treponema sp.]